MTKALFKHRQAFPEIVTLAIYGLHFRKVAEATTKPRPLNGQVGWRHLSLINVLKRSAASIDPEPYHIPHLVALKSVANSPEIQGFAPHLNPC